MGKQPKKIFRPVKFRDRETGVPRRYSYGKTIMAKETEMPKPLEYEDIDAAFNEFVEKEIELTDENGKRVPTFTLYSNQRFSEYSQTWEHTDEDGNLLMNFKTVNRQGNPGAGSMQGGAWNIPGERRFTTHMKTVLDDNGREHVEIYSMKQPYAVDLTYRINYVTNTFEMLNRFNERVHDLFKARQCYIRPNGHFIPMVLEDVSDETSYSIEERKFFVQSVSIKAMAYIIHEEDFEVKKYAKEVKLYGHPTKTKPVVSIEESEPLDEIAQPQQISLVIDFPAGEPRVEFEMDSTLVVTNATKVNISDVRVFVNTIPTYIENGFTLHEGDTVRVRIHTPDYTNPSTITFYGYDPEVYSPNIPSENVSEEIPQEVVVELGD